MNNIKNIRLNDPKTIEVKIKSFKNLIPIPNIECDTIVHLVTKCCSIAIKTGVGEKKINNQLSTDALYLTVKMAAFLPVAKVICGDLRVINYEDSSFTFQNIFTPLKVKQFAVLIKDFTIK